MTRYPAATPSRPARLAVALVAGLAAAWLMAAKIALLARLPPTAAVGPASDFDQVWFAGRALLAGADPYALIGPGRAFPWLWLFLYPASSGVVVLPLLPFPLSTARLLFVGVSTAALAYALPRRGWFHLLWLASPPVFIAVALGQWTPALTAAALLLPALPAVAALGLLAAVKPTVALALMTALPLSTLRSPRTWVAMAIPALAAVAVSLVAQPHWPAAWMDSARAGGGHLRPIITSAGGVLALLALLRWRVPEARALAALACVPQTTFWYDAAPLALVPRTRDEMLWLFFLAWAAVAIQGQAAPVDRTPDEGFRVVGQFTAAMLYVPCAVMILRRRRT